MRTNLKKWILAGVLRAKRPIFKLRENHSLWHQPTYKCDLHAKFEVSTLNGLAYSVRTNMKKNGFWHVFCARSAQFLNYEKISLYGINPHTNVTNMQNLRFLHRTVWRTAWGKTGKSNFGIFWGAKRDAPIF